jgi:hypothetical protein
MFESVVESIKTRTKWTAAVSAGISGTLGYLAKVSTDAYAKAVAVTRRLDFSGQVYQESNALLEPCSAMPWTVAEDGNNSSALFPAEALVETSAPSLPNIPAFPEWRVDGIYIISAIFPALLSTAADPLLKSENTAVQTLMWAGQYLVFPAVAYVPSAAILSADQPPDATYVIPRLPLTNATGLELEFPLNVACFEVWNQQCPGVLSMLNVSGTNIQQFCNFSDLFASYNENFATFAAQTAGEQRANANGLHLAYFICVYFAVHFGVRALYDLLSAVGDGDIKKGISKIGETAKECGGGIISCFKTLREKCKRKESTDPDEEKALQPKAYTEKFSCCWGLFSKKRDSDEPPEHNVNCCFKYITYYSGPNKAKV